MQTAALVPWWPLQLVLSVLGGLVMMRAFPMMSVSMWRRATGFERFRFRANLRDPGQGCMVSCREAARQG